MDLLACAIAATAAVYVFASIFFAIAFVRRQADSEYGVLAIMALALAEHATGLLLAHAATSLDAAVVGDKVAWVGLLAAFAMLVHFGLRYRGVAAATRYAAPVYLLAALLCVLDARGVLHDLSRVHDDRVAVTGFEIAARAVPLSRVGVAAYIAGCVAVAAVLALVARAYLAGKREALAVVIGTTALLATVINDVGVASGVLGTTYLSNVGFVTFVIAASTTFSARHVVVHNELERRTRELRTRTRELRRSYEELRAAQEELVRKEQLAVVGELAAVIAHEVRNPLAIIANAVSGLRKTTLSRDDHETLLSILDEETSRLNRLVTDLLRYARPINVQRAHILLRDLVDRTIVLTRQRRPGLPIDFQCEAHEARVWGDANLLRQVFDNLIENAVQAMGQGGQLTVRVRTMTDDGKDGLAVDIIDTGEGMDTQVRSRARDPFFTTRPSGTGLGLAIVDRIVDAHGGRFVIDSRAGEGTTVTVFLPYGSSSEPPPKPRKKQSSEPPPPPPPPAPSSVEPIAEPALATVSATAAPSTSPTTDDAPKES